MHFVAVNIKILLLCLMIGIVFLISGIILGYVVFPKVVNKKVWEATVLKEDTMQYDLFKKIPFPFDVKIYFYNVENPDDVLQGAQPVVREIGPYVYKMYRWRDEINWDNDDEISYNEYLRFHFDPEASFPLREDDSVTIVNTAYNSLLLIVEELSTDMLGVVDSALEGVFGEINGLFMKVKVRDVLFDGLKICENGGKAGGFALKAVCDQFKARIDVAKPMRVVNNTILYANLYYKNNTHQGRFTVKSGQKIKEEVANLVKYEYKPYMSTWKGATSKCNKIRGVTTFPPFVTKDTTFESFGEDICSVLGLKFENVTTVKGITGYKFVLRNDSFNAPKLGSDNYCYCINKSRNVDGSRGCLKNGLLDMSTCMGAPVLLSFPHLMNADKEYRASVKGLTPNATLHETFVVLEPTSGVPLKAAKRVQFNMLIRPIQDIPSIENVTRALMPLFWLEESVLLPDDLLKTIKTQLLDNLKLLSYIKWGIIFIGLICIFISLGLIIYSQ